MQILDSARRRFLLGVFVVSGFTGLIYESIWTHYLKLFLGHAAYAQSLVLAIFMGGMALGSWLIARYSSRIRRLLWAYVVVEGLIGVLGLVLPSDVHRRRRCIVLHGDSGAALGVLDRRVQVVVGGAPHLSSIRICSA